MPLNHEEFRSHIKSLLSAIEQASQAVGNYTWMSAATNVATLKQLIEAQKNSAAIHETDKTSFQILLREIDQAVRLDFFTDTIAAALNDRASIQAQFVALDPILGDHISRTFAGARR